MSAPHVLVVRYEHVTHSPEHFDASVENPSGIFDDAFFLLFLWTSNLQPMMLIELVKLVKTLLDLSHAYDNPMISFTFFQF